MQVKHGVNAVSLIKADAAKGFIILWAIKEYYPEILKGFEGGIGNPDLLLKIFNKTWPFQQIVFPGLVCVSGENCTFIVHEEWFDKSFIAKEETIQVIDDIVATIAKKLKYDCNSLHVNALIGPSNSALMRWNRPEDDGKELPVMAIREMVSSSLVTDLIWVLPSDLVQKDISDKANDLMRYFLLGIADSLLDVKSPSRAFFEATKTLDRLIEKMRELY